MVKLLLDSCVSKFALNELINSGYDAIWVPEHGKDPGDTKILEWAFLRKIEFLLHWIKILASWFLFLINPIPRSYDWLISVRHNRVPL